MGDAEVYTRRPRPEQAFWGLWSKFCSAAAAAGRLRTLHCGLHLHTAVLVRGLVQLCRLRSLRKLDLRLTSLPCQRVGVLTRLSSLSELTVLKLRVDIWWEEEDEEEELHMLRLPPELAALSRLKHLTGGADRRRRLPAYPGAHEAGLGCCPSAAEPSLSAPPPASSSLCPQSTH